MIEVAAPIEYPADLMEDIEQVVSTEIQCPIKLDCGLNKVHNEAERAAADFFLDHELLVCYEPCIEGHNVTPDLFVCNPVDLSWSVLEITGYQHDEILEAKQKLDEGTWIYRGYYRKIMQIKYLQEIFGDKLKVWYYQNQVPLWEELNLGPHGRPL